jgi:lysophospholipase L1-like esterase
MIRCSNLSWNCDKERMQVMIDEGTYYMSMIKEIAEREKIPLVCVVFPYLKPVQEYSEKGKEPYREVLGVLKALRIRTVDLHDYHGYSLNNAAYRNEASDTVHFNEEGNAVVEKALYYYLTESNFGNEKVE